MSDEPMSKPRYRVGCAGMFVLGTDFGMDDELDALAAAVKGPLGCEVLDTQTGEWFAPSCQQEADEILRRVDERLRSQGEETTA